MTVEFPFIRCQLRNRCSVWTSEIQQTHFSRRRLSDHRATAAQITNAHQVSLWNNIQIYASTILITLEYLIITMIKSMSTNG